MKSKLRIGALTLALSVSPLAQGYAREAHAQAQGTRTLDIVIDGEYAPARLTVREGERVRLRITQRDYSPCVSEIVFPSLGIRRTVPVNETVIVDLPALAAGEYAFRCGMSMIHGTLVVTAR